MRLTDQRLLALFREALVNAASGVGGYVRWKRLAWEWVAKNLDGETQKSMAERMLKHSEVGGEIDQTRERRSNHSDRYEFHYDFRFSVNGIDIYLETVLDETSTGPEITVVNAKPK